jgi:putative ABC transport system permease protein
MDSVLQDLRYAARTLLRTPGFTAVAVTTLALGIGANTAVFSVVEGVLLRSLPFPGADRLVDIKSSHGTSPLAAYETWRTATGVFEDMAAAHLEEPVLLGPEGADRLTTWVVTANFFPMLGGHPVLGRAFLPEEDRPGSAPLVVLSHSFWQSRLGGDAHVLGRTLTLDAVSYTIVGVMSPEFRMPAGFRHPDDTQAWLALGSFLSGPQGAPWARQYSFWMVGRLRPGTTLAEAQATLDVLSQRAWEHDARHRGLVARTAPLRDYLVGHVRRPLLLMLGAVSLVLLVACANAGSLLLSRGAARRHELAVRVALGASRQRLFRAGLTDAVLLAIAGGALGVLVAIWAVPVLVQLAGDKLPHLTDITVNVRVLSVALGVSVLTGVLAGVVPALRAGRAAPTDALKTAGAAARGRRWRDRPGDAFIVVQIALTMVLLSGAGLLARSFLRLVRLDPGFDPEHVVTAQLRLPATRYATGAARAVFLHDVLERVRSLPEVVAVAAGTGMPLAGYALGTVNLPGQPEDPTRPWAWFSTVSEDYFRTLGIPLTRGQPFRGDADVPQGVLIDEAMARAYFPGVDPLGRQIACCGHIGTVTGVVGNTRQESLHEPPPPHIYVPLGRELADYLKILIRTAADPVPMVTTLRRAIQEVDATVPIDRVAPMYELLGDARATQRFYALLLAVFAAAALLLAATGVYGIAAYAVNRRTQEIGIRMALGADRQAVLGLILAHGAALALVGIALGVGGALAATGVLRSYLFEIGPRDPVALGSVALLLLGAALLASYVPARRATRVDPMVALRTE